MWLQSWTFIPMFFKTTHGILCNQNQYQVGAVDSERSWAARFVAGQGEG